MGGWDSPALTIFALHGWRALPAAILLACLSGFLPYPAAAETVPLPRPRPPDLGTNGDAIPLPPLRQSLPPTVEAPAKPAPPSACQLRLPDIAEIEALPPVIAPNGCGIDDPVKIAAVRTADNRRIAINPPATLRCTTAEAVAYWVRDDIAT